MKRDIHNIASVTLGGIIWVCVIAMTWQAIAGAGLLDAGLPAGIGTVSFGAWLNTREAINERNRIADAAQMKRAASQLVHPSNQP